MSDEQKMPWTFAKVQLQGRAGMDGLLKYTASGKPILSFSVAVNRGPKEAKRTLWLTVKAFGDLAQNTQVRKGDMLTVEGNLDISTWQDRTTGAQRERTEVLADSIASKATQPKTPDWVEGDLDF